MRRTGALIVKNAAANVVRGLATAAVALTLPHFLTHTLDAERFAAWSLILQIASYASFLDFGLQTAIARFLAQAMEAEDTDRRDHLVSTALLILSVAGCVAFLLITLIVLQARHLFPGIPPTLAGEFSTAALCLALGSCVLLPLSTYTGILIGLHRNEYPALCIGIARIAGAVSVVVAARFTTSLPVLAGCLAVTNLLGGLAQWIVVRRLLPGLRTTWQKARWTTAFELARYCVGLSVWSFSMLLVSGLDVTIVGHFQFASVGVYSVAATLSMFFAGLNQSVVSALMTPVAALHMRGQMQEIASIVRRVTRWNAVGNLLLALLCFTLAPAMLRAWVGADYAQRAYPLLCLLVLAQAIRLTVNPYTVTLVALGQQNRALLPALSEAIANLLLSIAGMIWFGSIGVAVGTVAGSCVGVVLLIGFTVRHVRGEFPFSAQELLREGFLLPAAALWPLLCTSTLTLFFPSEPSYLLSRV